MRKRVAAVDDDAWVQREVATARRLLVDLGEEPYNLTDRAILQRAVDHVTAAADFVRMVADTLTAAAPRHRR
jgi:hypothetical protein